MKKWLTIAELGREAGVGVETIRYYQRLGLIAVPTHGAASASAWRRYGSDSVAELAFVRNCKALGFSLKQIGVLVQLRRARRGTCTTLHHRLEELAEQLEAKRRHIEDQQTQVQSLLDACKGGRPLGDCEALARIESGLGER